MKRFMLWGGALLALAGAYGQTRREPTAIR